MSFVSPTAPPTACSRPASAAQPIAPLANGNDAISRQRYQLGLTVNPGGNGFQTQPLMLRRTMIFGDLDLAGFKAKLQVAKPFDAS